MKTVLLAVDIQTGIVNDKIYNKQAFLDNVKRLIKLCRKSGTEVVYVRHDDGKGTDLAYGTENWEIYSEVAPTENEKIFDKSVSSAFKCSGLKQYLESRGTERIILIGLQTDFCIDANCKVAFEYGYDVIIPENTNSTLANKYMSGETLYRYYNYFIWNKRYAKVMSIEDVENIIIKGE